MRNNSELGYPCVAHEAMEKLNHLTPNHTSRAVRYNICSSLQESGGDTSGWHFKGGWGVRGGVVSEMLNVTLLDSASRWKDENKVKLTIICLQSLGLAQKCNLNNDYTISNSPESHESITICDKELWPRMSGSFFPILFSPFFIWLGMPWSKG